MTFKIWNVKTGAVLLSNNEHTSYVYIAKFNLDNKYIVTGCNDFTIKLWNFDNIKN